MLREDCFPLPSFSHCLHELVSVSEELAVRFGRLKMADQSFVLSPEKDSTVSSFGDGNEVAAAS